MDPGDFVHANLPSRLTRMIGRADEVSDLWSQLITTRFVAIVGAGGVAATHVAVAVGPAPAVIEVACALNLPLRKGIERTPATSACIDPRARPARIPVAKDRSGHHLVPNSVPAGRVVGTRADGRPSLKA